MPFQAPYIDNIVDVTATATNHYSKDSGAFTALKIVFVEKDGRKSDVTAFFRPADQHRAHAIASAITLSQHPIREAAE